MHVWRLVIDDALPGAVNMARDEAILDLYPTLQQPTLRMYRWAPACVSLGLAQRWARDVDHPACAALGIDVVRRPTGGRAILHDCELTYSVVVGLDHAGVGRGTITQSYRALSTALQASLARLGVDAACAPQGRRASHKSFESAACFDAPAAYELTVAGRKLTGSAQARQHNTLLQHGSLLLRADPARWAQVIHMPPTLDPHTLGQRMIDLAEVLGAEPAFAVVAEALAAGFAQACDVLLVPGGLTAAEEARAAHLAANKYAQGAWTARR